MQTIKSMISLQKGFLALMSVALLFSCSNLETFETADLKESDDFLAAKGKMQAAGADWFSYSSGLETCVGEEITVTFNIQQEGISCGKARVDVWYPGASDWTEKVAEGTPENGLFSFTFTPETAGEFRFRGTYSRQVLGGGNFCGANINGFEEDSAPLVAEVCSCDAEFTGAASCENGSRSAIFTFLAGEDDVYTIQGGLTAHISNVEVLEGATILRETGNGNVIISKTLEMNACDSHTIKITWDSDNDDSDVTGDWTVKNKAEETVGELSPLQCS
jgi:hypothetical protein